MKNIPDVNIFVDLLDFIEKEIGRIMANDGKALDSHSIEYRLGEIASLEKVANVLQKHLKPFVSISDDVDPQE